ncbi:head-tail adaptor protein [Donghicola eburneus]|uniref:phage head completion protein n=1 Tax=Donghicola eburneus TaxID=393278 RepID=UPI0008E89CEA|nr:head-tail adaptor protein [Donghicola eburneus]SFQ52428.1 head-tail adaptor [Donghicola eburneus]
MKRGIRVTDLDRVVSFQRRREVDDGHGNKVDGEFAEVFREWARVKPMKGGEGVVEARLSARQPAILTVRATTAAEAVNADWIAVTGGVVWSIKEAPRLTDDRQFLEMLVERGRVNG